MLIKIPHSFNVYRPASFGGCILEDEEVSEGEWRTNVFTDSVSSLQVPQTDHNASFYTKSVRKEFTDYFVNEGAAE